MIRSPIAKKKEEEDKNENEKKISIANEEVCLLHGSSPALWFFEPACAVLIKIAYTNASWLAEVTAIDLMSMLLYF